MHAKQWYTVLPEFKLVIEIYKGDLTYRDLTDLKAAEQNDSLFNGNYHMVMDLTKAEIKLSRPDFDIFISLMLSQNRLLKQKHIALITQTPDQYVQSYLLLEDAKLPVNITIVSTIEAGLNYFGFSNDQIFTILKEYKTISSHQ